MAPLPSVIRPLHVGDPAAFVLGIAVIRHIGTGQAVADVLDEADAEIGKGMRAILFGVTESGPRTEVDVLVVRRFRNRSVHFHQRVFTIHLVGLTGDRDVHMVIDDFGCGSDSVVDL